MTLSDINGFEDYLMNQCYRPGEIYDCTGFFYREFKPGDECTVVYEGSDFRKPNLTAMIVVCGDQLINIWKDAEDHVITAERYDATPHNTEMMKLYLQGKAQPFYLDKWNSGNYKSNLLKIRKLTGAVMI